MSRSTDPTQASEAAWWTSRPLMPECGPEDANEAPQDPSYAPLSQVARKKGPIAVAAALASGAITPSLWVARELPQVCPATGEVLAPAMRLTAFLFLQQLERAEDGRFRFEWLTLELGSVAERSEWFPQKVCFRLPEPLSLDEVLARCHLHVSQWKALRYRQPRAQPDQRQHATLQKIVAALALQHGFNPQLRRNPSTAELTRIVHAHGFPLEADTVRAAVYLAVAEQLPALRPGALTE